MQRKCFYRRLPFRSNQDDNDVPGRATQLRPEGVISELQNMKSSILDQHISAFLTLRCSKTTRSKLLYRNKSYLIGVSHLKPRLSKHMLQAH